ncbi:pilus assembly FimT family protein [Deinococcus humi]|uniref:Prepilin-type N-terminal cleavage/methylation domain-containing protein n=1 Tax=Deinococcus humi TaxID=662880 RepID=A0A7W8JYK4_9DEIO|nr:type II secretion system protein [Deinococcus humi]MBB5365601.1 prepilin-type N-terminal cleavage/methylation domain-containing protein [Deinococcus humi]GGO36429.1 pili assembly chaperone [Deinococcus humi]
MNRDSQGFTLLEILVVLAIIAILTGIFGVNLIRSIRTAELREAATQVATDFRRARSQAQRGSTDVVLVLPGISGGTVYKVDTVQKVLPNGAQVICKTTCGSGATTNVTYQAPYGELGAGATGSVYTVRSPINGISDLEIRIVGVTGKVILTKAGS